MNKKIFTIYIVTFFALWIIYVSLVYPIIQSSISNSLTYAFLNLLIRILLWVIPAAIYLKMIHYKKSSLKELFKMNSKGISFALLLSLLAFIMNLVIQGSASFRFNDIDLNTLINTIFLVPIIEEFVFRGVILSSFMSFFKAKNNITTNALTSILFLGIHIPGWLMSYHYIPIYYALSIFILSLLLGYLAQKYKSIVPSIIVHIANNVFSALFWA